MSAYLIMLLTWARSPAEEYRWCAWGYFLATPHLDDVERAYFLNVFHARSLGISA